MFYKALFFDLAAKVKAGVGRVLLGEDMGTELCPNLALRLIFSHDIFSNSPENRINQKQLYSGMITQSFIKKYENIPMTHGSVSACRDLNKAGDNNLKHTPHSGLLCFIMDTSDKPGM